MDASWLMQVREGQSEMDRDGWYYKPRSTLCAHRWMICLICISSPPGATHVAVRQYHDLFLWRWLMLSIVALVFQRVLQPRDQVVSPFTVPRLHGQPCSFSDAVWRTMLSLFPVVSFAVPDAQGGHFSTIKGCKGSKDVERDHEQHFCPWLPNSAWSAVGLVQTVYVSFRSFQVRSPIAKVTHPEWGVHGYTIGRTGILGRSAWKVNTAHVWHTSKLSCREMWRHDAWQLWLRGVNGRYGSQFSPKCNDMRNHPLPCSFAPSCHSMWSCLFSGLVPFFFAICYLRHHVRAEATRRCPARSEPSKWPASHEIKQWCNWR